jgi:hypothetical protein
MKQQLIDNIKQDRISYRCQDELSKRITGFYRKLYNFKEFDLEEGNFITIVQSYCK